MIQKEWIDSTLERAIAYHDQSDGDLAENLETALHLYESVLDALPSRGARKLRAAVENNLATAYSDRIHGDRGRNLERALSGYRRALKAIGRDRDPLEWARILSNSAAAHVERLHGDRAENLEKAIAAFRDASCILTRETAPLEWAQIMNNLGSTYLGRIAGDRLRNLEAAIDCFTQALSVQSRRVAPLERASTLENLAIAYCDRIVGTRENNLHRALKHSTEAVEILSRRRLRHRHAEALVVLAGSLFLLRNEEEGNLERAIRAYRRALQVLTRKAHPLLWARTQVNLGLAYEQRALLNHDRDLRKALAAFRSALEVYSREAMPHKFAFVQRNLGSLWFKRKQWVEALVAYSEALQADESLLGGAGSLASRQDFLRENRVALPRTAYCLARTGNLAAAATTLESGRTRTLAEILGTSRRPLPLSGVARSRDIRAVVDRLKVPLIYLAATSAGCVAVFILPAEGSKQRHDVLWLESFDLDRLHLQVYGLSYNVAILAGNDATMKSILDKTWLSWRDEISTPIAQRLSELGYRRAVLIPMGLLGLLPLASTALEFTTLAVAPSARLLRSVLDVRQDSAAVLCGVANPASDAPTLIFSGTELREIAALFPETGRRLLLGREASRAAFQSALPGASHVHIACHGQFQSRDVARSTFRLAGKETMEIRDFWQGKLNLSRCRLAVLSACSSGVIESRDQPDEALGLPAALLHVGVPTVLSSLWPVADASTALLLIRFYREHLVGARPPAEALATAQLWLREATSAELGLEGLYEESYREIPDPQIRAYAFRKMRFHRNNPDRRPFEHPFYWAGFFVSGVGFDVLAAGTTRAKGSAKTV